MATAIITSAMHTIDYVNTSINGEYLSNGSNVLRRVASAVRRAFGIGCHVLLDGNGKPYDLRTLGIKAECPNVADGRYVLTFSIHSVRLCEFRRLGNLERAIYDERVVNKVVDQVVGVTAHAISEMVGFRFPSFLEADVCVTVATTDEQHATVVVAITDKRDLRVA